VLQYHVRLIHSLGGTKSTWSFLFVSLLCVLVFWLVINKLLIEKLLLPFLRNRFARLGVVFTSELAVVAIVITGVANSSAWPRTDRG
jgi:hypothetical protein